MSIPPFIKEGLFNTLGFGISSAQVVFGGDINQNFRIFTEANATSYFLKFNTSEGHKRIIGSEEKALKLFEKYNISSPRVICYESGSEGSYLIMDYIQSNKHWNSDSIESFAELLASLHTIVNTQFGLNYSNSIGSLSQKNVFYESFTDYYWESRLLPQLELAYSSAYLSSPVRYEYLRNRLEDFPKATPRLLHGDLWSGNYLIDTSNKAYLIDPSISFGNREMDLSMMELFGGFPEAVFEAYNDRLPIHKSWRQRKELFQLYYLLVHLNLFGNSYLTQVNSILQRYR